MDGLKYRWLFWSMVKEIILFWSVVFLSVGVKGICLRIFHSENGMANVAKFLYFSIYPVVPLWGFTMMCMFRCMPTTDISAIPRCCPALIMTNVILENVSGGQKREHTYMEYY